MASAEWKIITQRDLFKEYPSLEEWFANPVNISSQLLDEDRLPSAQEKMDLFGGQTNVIGILSHKPLTSRISMAILMACRAEPMTGHEIASFQRGAGLESSKEQLTQAIDHLTEQELLGITGGLTYVSRSRYPGLFLLTENRLGFLTTNVVWQAVELPAEIRDIEAEQVAQLVEHPMVQSGQWASPYQIYAWKLIENLPSKFTPALEMAKAVFHPRFDWKAEAFRVEENLPTLTILQLGMRSRGSCPLNTPLLGRPTLKLEDVVSPVLARFVQPHTIKPRYREFLNLSLPLIFSSDPTGVAENINPDDIPAYNQIIVKPFWFFAGEGENERAVAEDPFRLVLHISGAPIAHIRRELQRVVSSLGDGKIKDKIFY